MHAARLLQPVIRRTGAYAARERLRTDGVAETSLDFVLMMLTRHGAEFEPRVFFEGSELMPRPDEPRATLFVGTHTMLATLAIRKAVDAGVMPVTISAVPMRVPGTRIDARIVVPSQTLLVTIRDLFDRNQPVVAALDRADAEPRTRPVMTKRGRFLISTPVIELALRRNARIVFLAGMLDEQWNVRLTFAAPARSDTIDDILEELASFIDAYVHRDRTA